MKDYVVVTVHRRASLALCLEVFRGFKDYDEAHVFQLKLQAKLGVLWTVMVVASTFIDDTTRVLLREEGL